MKDAFWITIVLLLGSLCLVGSGCVTYKQYKKDIKECKELKKVNEQHTMTLFENTSEIAKLKAWITSVEHGSKTRDGLIKSRLSELERFNFEHRKRWPQYK